MCEPTSIVMAVTAVASAAYSANQSHQQGKYQAGVAEYNASLAENEAQQIQAKSAEEENTQRRKTAELLSKQRAQLGASNVDLSSGSALQLQEDTEVLGEADALRIRSNYDNQVASSLAEADLSRSDGAFAESAANSAVAGSILGGISGVASSGVADKWYTPSSTAAISNSSAPELNMLGQAAMGV